MPQPRIAPLDPPYDPEAQKYFDSIMPPGMEPLRIFRTIATNPRILKKFFRGAALDRGPLAIRDRELVIHRTCARCGAEYEWGVHVNAFARPLEIPETTIAATVTAAWDDPVWEPKQAALVRLCDELHDTSTLSDACWEALRAHFDDEQILEFIYVAGLYHVVAFLVNGLGIELEDFGERFPTNGV